MNSTQTRTIKIVYALLLGMVVLAMAIVAWQRTVNPTHAVTLDAAGIAQELRGMNDLMTVKYVVQKQMAPHGDADPNEPMYMVQGTVAAAVDLKALQANEVHVDSLAVDILLPDPAITSTVIDDSQTKLWNREVRMWTNGHGIDPALRQDAVRWIDLQAQQSGILNAAVQEAEGAIRRILIASGMEKVTFRQITDRAR